MKDLCNYPSSRIDRSVCFFVFVFFFQANNENCRFCELHPFRNIREDREDCDKILL